VALHPTAFSRSGRKAPLPTECPPTAASTGKEAAPHTLSPRSSRFSPLDGADIRCYMGESTGSGTPADLAKRVLTRSIRHAELCDEIYCQICKQITANENWSASLPFSPSTRLSGPLVTSDPLQHHAQAVIPRRVTEAERS